MSLKKKCDFPRGSNVLSAADRKSWGGGGAWKRENWPETGEGML